MSEQQLEDFYSTQYTKLSFSQENEMVEQKSQNYAKLDMEQNNQQSNQKDVNQLGQNLKIMKRLELTGKSNVFEKTFFEDYIYKYFVLEKSSTPDSFSKDYAEHLVRFCTNTKFLLSGFVISFLSAVLIGGGYLMFTEGGLQGICEYIIMFSMMTNCILYLASLLFYYKGCQNYKPNYIMISGFIQIACVLISLVSIILFSFVLKNAQTQIVENFAQEEEVEQEEYNINYQFQEDSKLASLRNYYGFGTVGAVFLFQVYILKRVRATKRDMLYMLTLVKGI